MTLARRAKRWKGTLVLAGGNAILVGDSNGTGSGFGRRFFFLFLCGLLWIIPGFWNRTFLYGVAAWDCLLLLAWIADYLRLPKPRQLTVQRRWLSAPSLAVTSQVEIPANRTRESG